jgi:hypothetical protein
VNIYIYIGNWWHVYLAKCPRGDALRPPLGWCYLSVKRSVSKPSLKSLNTVRWKGSGYFQGATYSVYLFGKWNMHPGAQMDHILCLRSKLTFFLMIKTCAVARKTERRWIIVSLCTFLVPPSANSTRYSRRGLA